VAGVQIEGIVPSIDSVKVNVLIEAHVNSETIREIRVVGPDNEVVLGMSGIDDVVGLEHECSCDVWVEDAGRD